MTYKQLENNYNFVSLQVICYFIYSFFCSTKYSVTAPQQQENPNNWECELKSHDDFSLSIAILIAIPHKHCMFKLNM